MFVFGTTAKLTHFKVSDESSDHTWRCPRWAVVAEVSIRCPVHKIRVVHKTLWCEPRKLYHPVQTLHISSEDQKEDEHHRII